MGRAPRAQVENGTYHSWMLAACNGVYYVDDEDLIRHLRILRYVVQKWEWQLHMYCLMTTHWHLVLSTPKANIGDGMHVLNGLYATTFNKRHGRKGHLKASRYGSELIKTEAQAFRVASYVPLNPVRAGMCPRPEFWPWSSYAATLGLRRRPSFLDDAWLMRLFDDDVAAARVAYWAYVERVRLEAA